MWAFEVPHSGNACSGLCEPPCGHDDCWQCGEVAQRLADRQAAGKLMGKDMSKLMTKKEQETEIARLKKELGIQEGLSQSGLLQTEFDKIVQAKIAKQLEKDLLGGIPAATPGRNLHGGLLTAIRASSGANGWGADEGGTVQISRAALESLVGQTGGRVTMNWNNGDPVFYDRQGINLTPADVPGAFRDAGSRVAKMKAKGASDADIAAASKLLSAPPATAKGMSYEGISLDEVGWKAVIEWKVLRDEAAD